MIKEENMIHNEEKNQIIETNRNDTKIELIDKSIKIGITTVYILILLRQGTYTCWDKEDIKKNQIELQKTENVMSEIKKKYTRWK